MRSFIDLDYSTFRLKEKEKTGRRLSRSLTNIVSKPKGVAYGLFNRMRRQKGSDKTDDGTLTVMNATYQSKSDSGTSSDMYDGK